MPKKSARKSVRRGPAPKTGRPVGRPFQKGNDPRRGRGPKPGALNAGRPRKEFVQWCVDVVSDKKVELAVRTILMDPTHPQFANLYGKLVERAHGRPAGTDVQFPVDPRDLTDEQLQRVAAGEDVLVVLATSRGGGAGTPPAAPGEDPGSGAGAAVRTGGPVRPPEPAAAAVP